MNQTAIFWPMICHVLLVVIVYVVLGIRRRGAVESGEAVVHQFKGRYEEPARSVTVANNLMNQFEAPVLFHICCLCLYVTAGVSIFTVTLAWLFILFRYIHAYVHLTSNKIRWRNMSFRVGLLILLILWIAFAAHIA
ncbi:MAG: MAPEG family protein [Rhizobiaceae bacterium]